jgi:esterase/lipase superfamily enzyme
VPHLADFLEDLRARSGAEVIHLIAHSMGNRVLTRALSRLAVRNSGARFNEIVLAAPDVDVENFRQIAAEISGFGQRMSLYANSNDKALNTSEALRFGKHRAGDVEGGRIVLVDGVESIDASDLDTGFMGHSYFAEDRLVIRDISRVMADAAAPDDRSWLRRRSDDTGVWWAFEY